MATSRRFVQITDKEVNKIKITCAKILKQLLASGSVIIGEYYFIMIKLALQLQYTSTYRFQTTQ